MKIRVFLAAAAAAGILMAGCGRKDDPANPQSGGASAADTAQTQGLWMTDFEAAKAKAAAEGRDLLVYFTGSDWCYWCKRLDGEVFSRAGFTDEAGRYFVFVKLDYPSNPAAQPRWLRTQNERLARIYGVQAYPKVFLMLPDGRPYAQTGYQEGGPDAYLAHLMELRTER